MKIKLNLAEGTRPLSYEGGIDILVIPTVSSPLSQIPKGPNPRDKDVTTPICAEISLSWNNRPGTFHLINGGAQVIIDSDSFSYCEQTQTVEFSCTEEFAGNYDGAHSIHRVDQEVAKGNTGNGNAFRITLVNHDIYSSIEELREAAKGWNKRSEQKETSEANIRGSFDFVKNKINYTDLEFIGWKQHQLNPNGEKVKQENSAAQVLKLLLLLIPISEEPNFSVGTLASYAKKGMESVVKELTNDERMLVMLEKASHHIDYILELSDYIQTTLEPVAGNYYENFAMIRSNTKKQFELPVKDRKKHKQYTFQGTQINGALDKDYITMFLYAVLSECFDYSHVEGKFVEEKSLKQAKQIWGKFGQEVIKLADKRFKSAFSGENSNNRRKSDFVNDSSLWSSIERRLSKLVRRDHYEYRNDDIFEVEEL